MTDLRTAAQQALEALEEVQKYGTTTEWFDERVSILRAALAEPVLNPAPGYCKHCKQYTIEEPLPAEPMTTLREAAQNVVEVWKLYGTTESLRGWMEILEAALAEPVQDGFDQLIAETEADSKGAQALEEGRRWVNEQFYAGAEPVAWRFQSAVGGWAYGSQPPLGSKYTAYPLYAAPPQRNPEPVALDWLHKWANQDDGEPETQWHEGYEAARRVVQIHLTTPPQRKPLTEEEIERITSNLMTSGDGYLRFSVSLLDFARAIEAALKERNA